MLYFTTLPKDEVERICAPETGNINRAKEILAYEATALAHGPEEAAKAFCAAGSKFGFADEAGSVATTSAVAKLDLAALKSAAISDLPTYSLNLSDEGIWIVKLLADAGLCKSNGDARRLIQAGGAYLNEERLSDLNRVVTKADFAGGTLILKAGKKNVKRIVMEPETV